MDSLTAIVVAAVLLSLPFVLLVLVVIVIGSIIGAFDGLARLITAGPRYWLLATWITIDIVVLVPLGILVMLMIENSPGDWQSLKQPIAVFTLSLLVPTTLQYLYCKLKDGQQEKDT